MIFRPADRKNKKQTDQISVRMAERNPGLSVFSVADLDSGACQGALLRGKINVLQNELLEKWRENNETKRRIITDFIPAVPVWNLMFFPGGV